jgi:hypothetical protein
MRRGAVIAIGVLWIECAALGASQAPPAARRQQQQPAQTGAPAADRQQPEAAPDALSDAELAAALDAYALVQAQQQLSIPDGQYNSFAARLKRVQDVRRRNQRMRFRLVQDLRRLAGPRANPPGDDAAIKAALTALREHDERAAAELRQAYDALDQVLDPRQQARFRLFEEHIEQRKLELLLRAKERARQSRRPPG